MNQSCPSCHNSYDGSDGVLRCRVHHNGLECSPEAAKGCKSYQYEPGADAEESPWFTGAWCLEFITPKSKETNGN